jgi:hypothetical protein
MKAELEEVKQKTRGMEAKVRKVKKMKTEFREMRKRLRQLEDDNAQLRATVHQLSPPKGPSRPTAETLAQGLELRTRPAREVGTWLGGGDRGLDDEMLWCFPFLKSYSYIPPGRFVVDDLQYPPPPRISIALQNVIN